MALDETINWLTTLGMARGRAWDLVRRLDALRVSIGLMDGRNQMLLGQIGLSAIIRKMDSTDRVTLKVADILWPCSQKRVL